MRHRFEPDLTTLAVECPARTHPPAWAPIMLFAVTAVVHFLHARLSVSVPYIFGDEAGYLTKAAALAGYTTDAYSSYYPGYALLLAPLFLLHPRVLTLYPAIQTVNALLAGAGAVLLWRLARKLAPARSARHHLAAALIVGFYPSFLGYSAFALSENLFIPLTLSLGLLLVERGRHPTRRALACMVTAGSALLLTHPKGLLVLAAGYTAWLGMTRHAPWRRTIIAATAAATLATAFVLAKLLDAYFKQRMGFAVDGLSGHYPQAAAIAGVLAAVLSFDGWRAMALNLVGQGFYLVVASAGLAAVGVAGLAKNWWTDTSGPRPEHHDTLRCYARFALLSLALTMGFTALFMHDGGRVDHAFFGRYDEGVIALVLLPAVLGTTSRRRAAWVVALIAASGLLLVAAHGRAPGGMVVSLNVLGFQLANLFDHLALTGNRLDLLRVTLVGMLAAGLLAALPNDRWRLTAALMLFLATAVLGSVVYLQPENRLNVPRHRITDFIARHYPRERCVDYDIRRGQYWGRYNYQVTLLPVHLHESAISPLADGARADGRSARRCSDLVISARADLDRQMPSARVLEREYGSDERLWLAPR